ncbi:hypothetical protein IAT38_004639 [Cryptococcus sp. DSM 104549]
MSFFQPTVAPNGSVSTHQAVRPPHPSTMPPIPTQNDAQEPASPRPCPPSMVSCPGPIPPHVILDETFPYRDDPTDSWTSAASLPAPPPAPQSHIHSQAQGARPIPIPAGSQLLIVPSITYTSPSPTAPTPRSLPPSYVPPSPPTYKPLPTGSDTTLLLAPPPSFYQATCPHLHQHAHVDDGTHGRDDEEALIASHSCPYCFHRPRDRREREARTCDRVVAFLVLLNIVVWGAVIWGYYCEFTGGGGVGRICWGEECRWAFVDC